MKIITKGKNIEITEALKNYIEEKLSRIGKHFGHISKMEVELFVEKNPSIADNQIAEVTIITSGPVIRAKEASVDMYATIDKISKKIERQVMKYKEKAISRTHRQKLKPLISSISYPEEKLYYIETKSIEIKPMTVDEAITQMELLDYEFYLFRNAENELLNLVYRKKNGQYILVEPTI